MRLCRGGMGKEDIFYYPFMLKMVLCLQKYGLNKFMQRKLHGKVVFEIFAGHRRYKMKIKNKCLM